MSTVQILLSSYNGGAHIENQIRTIMNQYGAEVHLLVRDDGSTDNTVCVLESLQKEYQGRIKYICGDNIGWKRSFMELIYLSGNYDYYGFSDQDDIWMSGKVCILIELMEADKAEEIKLAHCNCLSVDQNMKDRSEQEYRIPYPKSHKAAIAMEYFQGCGMLWNSMAMKKIKEYRPMNQDLAHDYWVGLICYFFGKVYFCSEPKFYHIRYESNSSEDGNMVLGRMKRVKLLLGGLNAYMNPAQDLLKGYRHDLLRNDINFIENICNYKISVRCKMKVLFDKSFRRTKCLATVYFKLSILINNY